MDEANHDRDFFNLFNFVMNFFVPPHTQETCKENPPQKVETATARENSTQTDYTNDIDDVWCSEDDWGEMPDCSGEYDYLRQVRAIAKGAHGEALSSIALFTRIEYKLSKINSLGNVEKLLIPINTTSRVNIDKEIETLRKRAHRARGCIQNALNGNSPWHIRSPFSITIDDMRIRLSLARNEYPRGKILYILSAVTDTFERSLVRKFTTDALHAAIVVHIIARAAGAIPGKIVHTSTNAFIHARERSPALVQSARRPLSTPQIMFEMPADLKDSDRTFENYLSSLRFQYQAHDRIDF